MATSLVSTGVQFPDSTIQTTAATASAAPGLILLSTVTASSSSTVSLETGIGSSYDFYCITMQNVLSSASSYLVCRLKVGGTYDTGSYNFKIFGGYANSSVAAYGSQSESSIALSLTSDAGSTNTAQGVLWFDNPTDTSSYKKVMSQVMTPTSSTQMNIVTGGGFYGASTAALTGVRFLFNSGSITSGVFRLYGYSK